MAELELATGAGDSRPRSARDWRSTGLGVIAIATAVTGFVLGLRPSPPSALEDQNLPGSVATLLLALLCTAVGVVLRRRRPENAVGWLLLAFGVTAAVTSLMWGVTYVSAMPGGDFSLGRTVAWVGTIVSMPAWVALMTSLIVRFPSGQATSGMDRRVLRTSAVTCAFLGALIALRPGQFLIYPAFSNPLELTPPIASSVTIGTVLAAVAALTVVGVAAVNAVGRYRHASQVERLQLRWFAFSALIAVIGGSLYVAVGVFLAPNNDALRESTYVVLILSVCTVPVAVLEAITRHRLYDIDRIIGRTFAYGALTAILAGLYAASLRLFNALFVTATGENSEAALVLTTLVLATTFTPIKQRLERVAERRFKSETPGESAGEPTGVASPDDDATLAALEARLEATLDARLDARLDAAVRSAVDDALGERAATTTTGEQSVG